MKKAIILLIVMSAGAWATDYFAEDGDVFGSLGLLNHETLFMRGMGGGWMTAVPDG